MDGAGGMTRTELIELAARLADARVYGRDIEQAADFLRQLAESKPAAWEGPMRLRWRQQSLSMKPLYRLPLDD